MMRYQISLIAALVAAVIVAVVPVSPAYADDVRDDQWYLDALDMDRAHGLSQGEGVTIGVIDSGIDETHPDLEGSIQPGRDYGSSRDKGLDDARGHGTSTTSLLVGHGHGDDGNQGVLGIAPKAKVVSVGVSIDPEEFDYEWIGEAIKWLADEGVDIISVTTVTTQSPEVNGDAVEYATKKGIPVVSPAGNDEPEYDDILGEIEGSKTTNWPAQAAGAIPVSGTNQSSNFWDKSLTLRDTAPQPQLGLSAPATELITAERGGGYATHSGTSGSAPIVAGTLALIKSAYPDLTYFQWVDRLLDTTDDKGPKGFDDKFGAGIVNPYRALTEETKYTDEVGKVQVSSPDDRLPLAEQGKGSSGASGEGDDKESDGEGGTLATSGIDSTFLTIGIVAAVVVAVAVLTTTIVIVAAKRRRAKLTAPTVARSSTHESSS